MAYMVREGLADFAITEDSDLIAYGCPKTVMKLNYNGYGLIFDIEWFRNEKNQGKDKEGKALYDDLLKSLQKIKHDEFQLMCIIGGCDYSQGIERVGLKTLLKQHIKAGSCHKIIQDFIKNKQKKDKIPSGFWEQCLKV